MTSPWWQIDHTHDPSRTSWVASAQQHRNFPIQNLPYGLFSPGGKEFRVGVAIGEEILDLRACAELGLLQLPAATACREPSINRLLSLRSAERTALRRTISDFLSDPSHCPKVKPLLHSMANC